MKVPAAKIVDGVIRCPFRGQGRCRLMSCDCRILTLNRKEFLPMRCPNKHGEVT